MTNLRSATLRCSGRGIFAASLLPWLVFACGESNDSGLVANPIETQPAPNQPGAGLDANRPNPCRGVALPPDQHYVAPGLCASAVALEQPNLRQISFASNGSLIGVEQSGSVIRYRDVNDDGMFDGATEIVRSSATQAATATTRTWIRREVICTQARRRAWCAGGTTRTRRHSVRRSPSSSTNRARAATPFTPSMSMTACCTCTRARRTTSSPPASPDYDTARSVLKRFDLAQLDTAAPFDWATGEVVASGLRNIVGYTRDASGKLFGVVNGIDNLSYQGEDVHLDNPGEVLIGIEPGQSFGYPFCFTAQNISTAQGPVQPGTQLASQVDGFTNPHDDAWCAQSSAPGQLLASATRAAQHQLLQCKQRAAVSTPTMAGRSLRQPARVLEYDALRRSQRRRFPDAIRSNHDARDDADTARLSVHGGVRRWQQCRPCRRRVVLVFRGPGRGPGAPRGSGRIPNRWRPLHLERRRRRALSRRRSALESAPGQRQSSAPEPQGSADTVASCRCRVTTGCSGQSHWRGGR